MWLINLNSNWLLKVEINIHYLKLKFDIQIYDKNQVTFIDFEG